MSEQNGRRCRGTKDNGDPCRSPIVGVDGFCEVHRLGNREEIVRRAHRGAEVTRKMFEAGLTDLPDLRTPADAQVWLEAIGRAVALNKLSGSAARAAISGVREWLKAYKAGEQAERIERLQEAVEELRGEGVLPQ